MASLKVPREGRTSTNNKQPFTRMVEEPYSHMYEAATLSGVIKRLIPTRVLAIADKALYRLAT